MKYSKLPSDNVPLNLSLILSILIVIIILLFSKNIPNLFIWGDEFEKLLFNLSLAVISSYIFYVIVVHSKIKKDSENINIFLAKLTINLLNSYEFFIDSIKDNANIKSNNIDITVDDMKKICSALVLKELTDICLDLNISSRMNWQQFVYLFLSKQQKDAHDIYVLMPFLDSVYIKLLSDFTTNALFDKLQIFEPNTSIITNENFSNFHTEFYELHSSYVSLKEYYSINLLP
ncbi:hypothetical protein [Pseudoalteromonas marina]|uniref:Phage abortive infection protein n=1 Tax=Pseudoalteromonas marina TaxID=267375 RepID=A0ABT9FAE3_9GAMM|nr:hypothetical protein [Pseudoalteromonas marina]MDP2563755.1 hypothetical protein [Pseudoalteromonas marina]